MKPVVGICTNYSANDELGLMTKLGLPGQEWQMVADDYIKAIERGGGVPVIIPLTKCFENISPILPHLDGIVFTGGSDIDPQKYGENSQYGLGAIDPDRDEQEIKLAKKVLYEMNIPVLGICRGQQIINIAAGGSLYYDLKKQRPEAMCHPSFFAPKYHKSHEAKIEKNTNLHRIFNKESIGVNSFHHQAVKELADGFIISMVSVDGVIEGMELPGERFVVSVQWHPEMMIDRYPEYTDLFRSFVESCKGNNGND